MASKPTNEERRNSKFGKSFLGRAIGWGMNPGEGVQKRDAVTKSPRPAAKPTSSGGSSSGASGKSAAKTAAAAPSSSTKRTAAVSTPSGDLQMSTTGPKANPRRMAEKTSQPALSMGKGSVSTAVVGKGPKLGFGAKVAKPQAVAVAPTKSPGPTGFTGLDAALAKDDIRKMVDARAKAADPKKTGPR